MIIVMNKKVTQEQIDHVVDIIEKLGLQAHISKGTDKCIIGIIGDERKVDKEKLLGLDYVEKVMPVQKPYRRVSREIHPDNTIVEVKGVKFGGKDIVMIAGPCACESEEQMFEIEKGVSIHKVFDLY